MYPEHLRYTREHEWARIENGRVRVGITQFAAERLSDVVFIELPAPGSTVKQLQPFGVIESVKAVSDLYAPVSGTVAEVNPVLAERRSPEYPFVTAWVPHKYIPLTPQDREHMLRAIGAAAVDDLFADIPRSVRLLRDLHLPPAPSDAELLRELAERSARNGDADRSARLLGAGASAH